MTARWARGLAVLTATILLATACSGRGNESGKQMPDVSDALPAGSIAAFYGDSLGAGVGASSPERRWPSVLCARRGWIEINPSIPGLGFVRARGTDDLPGQIVAASPDVVFVTLGHNDLWLVDSEGPAIEAAIRTDLDRLRTGLPDADILVFALFSPLAVEPPQVARLNGWLRAAATEVGARFVTKSSGWLAGHRSWTVDGIHFSDAGNAAIAELVDAELRRVLRD